MISLTILLVTITKQTYQQQQQIFSNLTESFVNPFVSLNDELNTANTVSATDNRRYFYDTIRPVYNGHV